jgi:hypothetical protein
MNDLNHSWKYKFPPYTDSNLETKGVIYSDDHAICFVETDHPAAILMGCNTVYFGFDIQMFTIHDGKYFKVPKRLLKSCCDIMHSFELG